MNKFLICLIALRKIRKNPDCYCGALHASERTERTEDNNNHAKTCPKIVAKKALKEIGD